MNRKWSFLGKCRFYKLDQAMELLTNMSDCEDESTSESKNEGDSSKDAPEQHQVTTDSNIVMPKETEVSKAKEIPNKGQKAAPKLVDNQSATNRALLADQTATTSGASPAEVSKVSKAKEIPNKGQKAAPKLVGNQSATNHALLANQTATTSGASPAKVSKIPKAKEIPNKGQKAAPKLVGNQSATKHALLADQTATTLGASPAKVSKAKEIPKKGQKAAPKLVGNQSATKAIASNSSDMDVDDYYVIEDANESDSSKYVPCVNYANDKVYPEDVKNGWVRLEQDTGPPIFRGLRDPVVTTLI